MSYQDSEIALLRSFGERLRKLRRERTGLSQENFARECGLARTYVASVERGLRNISLLNICRIAEALGITPAELLKFSSPSAPGRKSSTPKPGGAATGGAAAKKSKTGQ